MHQERSTNKSSGFNAGVAIKVSNGVAAGVTVGGNYGKGYGNGDETTYASSYIGDKHSLTTLTAGGNAALIGSQLKGKRVELNSENLTIESLQEKASYKGKQMQVSGQVTVGYGFAMGGNYSRSKVSSDYASVREQAGIFAGEGGYHVNVNKHTNLIGGVITSSAQVESEGKNRFETDTLAYSDIQNHANYQGSAIGLGGSIAMNFDTPFGEHGQAQNNKQAVNEQGEKLYIDSQGRRANTNAG
ncbi:hemagglutinin repeat-containing protein [Avibacterium paragallinarum]|uniref:hemagglutinin repeat-containing protein n=1 Tax=Avibacterium paragallinarum TaxID=728 RepID=UPI001FB0377F|nr:hemagglutinin repeat-containing protein [Avibacterium paragallinarum]WAM60529.1 hemagglutinin repeat-containing protein [Avibacterium paragallinarum]